MLKQIAFFVLVAVTAQCQTTYQESNSGISVPMTLTGSTLYTNAESGGLLPAFRAVLYPTVKLGSHWFLYSALNVQSTSYLAGTGYYYDENRIRFDALQAFVGYSGKVASINYVVKAGQLSSAFGLAPSNYDDSKMALTSAPIPYNTVLNVRNKEIALNKDQLLHPPEDSDDGDGSYGTLPVTLYGLPGAEIDVSAGHFDGRLQFSNSSPSNPQGLLSSSQSAVWTAGGGVTLPGNLHIGTSFFRGPYLDRSVTEDLPPAASFRDFKASGLEFDFQWARQYWSFEGEWDHFDFEQPYFTHAPVVHSGYAQVKRILSPRTFIASRVDVESFGRVTDLQGQTARRFEPTQKSLELSLGYRLNRHYLVKAGYALTNIAAVPGDSPSAMRYLAQMQIIADLTAISRAFK